MDISNASVAKALISEINSQEFDDRRRCEYKAYKVAEGAQKEYVVARLRELFPKSYNVMRISDISLSNKIVSKLSKAYKESPTRELSSEEKTEKLDSVYSTGMFDRAFKEFDRDFNRQRYGLLWVNKVDDKLMLHSLKGYESFVARNPITGELEAVILSYPDTDITHSGQGSSDGVNQKLSESQDDSSAQSEVYAMWTKDQHAVYRSNGEAVNYVPIEDNENNVNPLGMLPFVFASRSSSSDLPFVNQITDQSIEFNVLNSDRLSASSLQGFGVLLLKLREGVKIEQMHTGMTTGMTLPLADDDGPQNDAQYLSPSPDLAGMGEVVMDYVSGVLDEHGISSSGLKGNQNFSSGLERLIANADVSDQISENMTIYSDVEQKVFDIVARYMELEGDRSFINEEMTVTYSRPKVMISDRETLENIRLRLDMGLISEVEAMQIIDPNLSPAKAQDKLDKIQEAKVDKASAFFPPMNEEPEEGEEDANIPG